MADTLEFGFDTAKLKAVLSKIDEIITRLDDLDKRIDSINKKTVTIKFSRLDGFQEFLDQIKDFQVGGLNKFENVIVAAEALKDAATAVASIPRLGTAIGN